MQTSYSIFQGVSQPGQLADMGMTDIVSAAATSDVAFGQGLAVAGQDLAKVPGASSDQFMGVAVLVQHKEQALGTGLVVYKQGDLISVVKKGRVWVKVETAVAAGDSAFVRFQGTGVAGSFRNDSDSGNASAVPSGHFRTVASAGGLAILEINLPV